MAIFNPVMNVVRDMLALPNFCDSPFLCLGVQDIEKGEFIPDDFRFDTLGNLLRNKGVYVEELDPFDDRAILKFNLNEPVPANHHNRFSTILDYGCIEHIFDTRMVIENCMKMVKVGGLYAIHTPVRNFANHGLHTFSSELFRSVMEVNNFQVVFERFTTSSAVDVDMESDFNEDVIGWIVGKKLSPLLKFVSPEQKRYAPK